MTIEVLRGGSLTTVQDRGRHGHQARGMPVAGAMDQRSLAVANLLVGNDPGDAVLEMTLAGGSFRFPEGGLVAVAGAEMGAELDGLPVTNWSCLSVPGGGVLSFGYAVEGCRAYLAIAGGIEVPLVLGSRATYARAGIGGFEGRALRKGDRLDLGIASAGARGRARPMSLPERLVPPRRGELELRVLPGFQEELFESAGLEAFYRGPYLLSVDSDRMGCRFEGPRVALRAGADIVSDAVCAGAVQVPSGGLPIVLMADRQTTGGYAKLGAVVAADLPLLAQARPGDPVRFVAVDEEKAVAALREELARLESIAAYLAESVEGGI